jgi:nucleotidyltransferase/DNA polymerase involved in DNA repair
MASRKPLVLAQILAQTPRTRRLGLGLFRASAIYLPNFYLQAAFRHQPDLREKPVALLDDRQPKSLVLQLNQAAELAGVRTGMTASQGLARSLDLVVKNRMPAQEKQIEEIVLHFAFTLAPYVEATGPGLCTIQFTTRKSRAQCLARGRSAERIRNQRASGHCRDTRYELARSLSGKTGIGN